MPNSLGPKQMLSDVAQDVTTYVSNHYGKQASVALTATLANLSVSWNDAGYRDARLAPTLALSGADRHLATARFFSLDLFGAFLTWYLLVLLGSYLLRTPVKAAANSYVNTHGEPPPDAPPVLHQAAWMMCDKARFSTLPRHASPSNVETTATLTQNVTPTELAGVTCSRV